MDAGAGNIYVPLFLVEGLLNIAGYFIIVYAVDGGMTINTLAPLMTAF